MDPHLSHSSQPLVHNPALTTQGGAGECRLGGQLKLSVQLWGSHPPCWAKSFQSDCFPVAVLPPGTRRPVSEDPELISFPCKLQNRTLACCKQRETLLLSPQGRNS